MPRVEERPVREQWCGLGRDPTSHPAHRRAAGCAVPPPGLRHPRPVPPAGGTALPIGRAVS